MAFTRSNTAENLEVQAPATDTQFQNQDPVTIPNQEPVVEPEVAPETKSKSKGKGKVLKDLTTEPKVEEPVVTNEPVINEPVAETKVEEPVNIEDPTAVSELQMFKAMSTDQVWNHFGGYDKRGVISQAIRHLSAVGMTNSEIASKLQKRYQHVRNVLKEPIANQK